MKRACLAMLLYALPLAAADSAVIYYSKYFKGSVPEFVAITLDRAGQVTYKEAADDDRPLNLQLAPEQTSEIFALADKLGHFSHALESPLKVAHMGFKTFRWEEGAAKSEVKFNFSEDADARTLTDWFERITETEQHYYNLERTVKFDKLGVNQVLLQLQITFERKRLVGEAQFLPLLDRVSRNESFMHIARERASGLAEAFRNPAPTKGEK
jgi:hypothetical protein